MGFHVGAATVRDPPTFALPVTVGAAVVNDSGAGVAGGLVGTGGSVGSGDPVASVDTSGDVPTVDDELVPPAAGLAVAAAVGGPGVEVVVGAAFAGVVASMVAAVTARAARGRTNRLGRPAARSGRAIEVLPFFRSCGRIARTENRRAVLRLCTASSGG
ncbi:hypothetical protein [Curtobacterium sp. B18]|uniref:hypothetical protein n=1 Tax=Curtobacterium sp. B18 TaxID=95614 RepID=UPI0011D2B3FA|nr:hypothetical protein [Curtobacterium sp. B18]